MKTKYLWIIFFICIALVFGVKMLFSPIRPGHQLASFDQVVKALPGSGPYRYGVTTPGFRHYQIYHRKKPANQPRNIAALRSNAINDGYYSHP
ncbi:hypothetical protein [Pelagibaculum spongiae]|uniref:Uncharacterized protein n=1 Tax=Pelagibaculum spongiae TaxID=2080658 RepID=A0A2V1H7J8_9GAMM|nr:hypothetical protein [Pelagibaculum spongiae]PVZ72452.1 hypothetical protein DC094_05460 [Pelagibaculum spongiae]